MSRVCELTGKRSMTGNNVSHALYLAKRRFHINLFETRFYFSEECRYITLKVAASTLRTINKKGISTMVKEARKNGILKK